MISLQYIFPYAGMKLQRLMGKIEFVNVSFYYPSRLTVLFILERYILKVI